MGDSLLTINQFNNNATILFCLWDETGGFFQNQWNRVLDTFGESQFDYWVTYTMVISILTYWGLGILFMVADLTPKLRPYKVQPGTNEQVSDIRLIQTIAVVLINQFLVTAPLAYMSFVLTKSWLPDLRWLPSFRTIAFDICVLILVREVAFYYLHRLIHHRFFYKRIHKIHHHWTSPVAIAAIYCHPIEHVIVNLFPITLGLNLLRSHLVTSWIWIGYTNLHTLVVHSGYHLPFLISPEAHDFHHAYFDNCYGVLGFMDWLHGTNKKFKDSLAFKRHKVMFHLQPPRKMYPDKTKS